MQKFRNTIKSSIAGAGLATIVACSGGGPGPDPKPTPTVTTTSTMSAVRNLDNPGATTSYVGDRLEADVTIDVVTQNFTGTPAYVDTYRIAHDGVTPQLYQGGNVPTVRNTIDWKAGSVSTPTTITPTGDVRVYNTVTSQTDQKLFTYTTAVHTIAPLPVFSYTAAQANPKIKANESQLATLLSTYFCNPADKTHLTVDQWTAILDATQDGVGPEATSYDDDFVFKAFRLNGTNGTMSVVLDETVDATHKPLYTLNNYIKPN